MNQTVLGGGLSFPIKYDVGRIKTAEGIASVVSAIWMLFATPKGKRFMLPEYGSDLHQLVFEPCTPTTGQMAAIFARIDIEEWIPRVEYVRVNFELDNANSTIRLIINFRLVNSPTEAMMIYPFYLESNDFQSRALDPNFVIL